MAVTESARKVLRRALPYSDKVIEDVINITEGSACEYFDRVVYKVLDMYPYLEKRHVVTIVNITRGYLDDSI